MRILEVISSLDLRGGAEVFLLNLVSEFKKNPGNTIGVVCLYDNVCESFSNNFKDIGLQIWTCGKHRGVDIAAGRRFRKIVENFSPDIVHMHRSCLTTYWLAFGSGKKKWKLFRTVHSIAGKDAGRLATPLIAHFLRKKTLTLIGISPMISKSICDAFGTDINDVPTILIGTNQQRKTTLSVSPDSFVCVACFRPEKNHSMLIDAFEKVYRQNPNARLTCVGGGPLLNEIKNKAEGLSCREAVKFTGEVSDVSFYLEKSSIFVLASRYEGTPVSVLEAMNLGLAVVLPRVGGIPDIVSDENGILYEPDSRDALADAMIKIGRSESNLKEICSFNINGAGDRSISTTARKYLSLFGEQDDDN